MKTLKKTLNDTLNETLKEPYRNPLECLETVKKNHDKKPWNETLKT